MKNQKTSKSKLKCWQIHDVILKNVRALEIENKKSIKFTFTNDEGYYDLILSEPDQKDFTRPVVNNIEYPSKVEILMHTLKHIGDCFVPEIFSDNKGFHFKTFDDLVKYFVRIMKPAKNKPTQIKLIGNDKDEACLPDFTTLNKDVGSYIRASWLGDLVFFTASESKQIINREIANSKKPVS